MSHVAELLERVKAATGPDQELDYSISRFVDGELARHSSLHRPYTASIDAAVALAEQLLPVGMNVVLKLQAGGKYFHAEIEADDDDVAAYNHPSLPLAILAATLSALSNRGEQHD